MAVSITSTNDIVRVVVKAIAGGQQIINVLHFGTDLALFPTGPPPTLEALLISFREYWRGYVLFRLTNVYTVLEYQAIRLTGKVGLFPTTPQYGYGEVTGGGTLLVGAPNLDTGMKIGDYLPTFNAATIRRLTNSTSRRFRGSIHLGPISEADTTGQELQLAERNSLTAAMLPFITPGLDAGPPGTIIRFFDGVLSRKEWLGTTALIPPDPPGDHWKVTQSFSTNPRVGSMLSRKA